MNPVMGYHIKHMQLKKGISCLLQFPCNYLKSKYDKMQTVDAKCCSNLAFVPHHIECNNESITEIQNFIDHHDRLFVLTGAGISTESGIPDYRSEGVGLYATSTKRPVQIKVLLFCNCLGVYIF